MRSFIMLNEFESNSQILFHLVTQHAQILRTLNEFRKCMGPHAVEQSIVYHE